MDDKPHLQSSPIPEKIPAQHDVLGRSFERDGDRIQHGTRLRSSRRFSHKHDPKQIPWTYADIPSSYGLSHGGKDKSPDQSCGEARDVPTQSTFREKDVPAASSTMSPVTRINTLGLPPTPPTTIDSNAHGSQVTSLSNDLQFADAVRDALHSQSSSHRISTSGAHTIPHTPDASPPSIYPVTGRAVQLPQHPLIVQDADSNLRGTRNTAAHPSLSASHIQGIRGKVSVAAQTAENVQDTEPEDTRRYYDRAYRRYDTGIDEDHRKRAESLQLNLSQHNLADDDISEVDSSPGARQYQFGSSSSNECSETSSIRRSIDFSETDDAALGEKTGVPGEPNYPLHHPRHDHSDGDLRARSTPAYLDLLLPPPVEKHVSAEDVNNLVYQHIQQANVQKHGISENDTEMPLDITGMYGEKRHALKRTMKCPSLRENASDGSPRNSLHDYPPRPRDVKRFLQSSPVVERVGILPKTITARYVSSPLPERTLWSKDVPTSMHDLAMVQPVDKSDVRQHMLRRSRKVDGFQRSPFIAPVTTIDDIGRSKRSVPPISSNTTAERTLRRFSHEHKLENLRQCRQTSEELHSLKHNGLDMHHVHASPTPMSQFSDRTEAEVLEARGVSLFPHHNESLLVVQNGSGVSNKDAKMPSQDDGVGNSSAFDGLSNSVHPTISPDSPLTHPRRAPEPPIVAVIPPTPNDEVDRQLNVSDDKDSQAQSKPQSQPSLLQRARRYSEGVVQPLLGRSYSLRKHAQHRPSTAGDERPVNLSPFWKPRYFWEDVESDEEYDEYGDYDDENYHESSQHTLPRGGDTSNVQGETRRVFPRNMSVRMPGFRGKGGFLVGNSLGLDRHGTNNRRHYIARTRASEEVLRQVSKDWKFTLPSRGEKRAHHFGLTRLKRRFIDQRLRKQDREQERRCQILKDQIQH